MPPRQRLGEYMRAGQALPSTPSPPGLSDVMSPTWDHGTLKMLVGGAGQIKLTKDGGCLLQEMQIQHPTAMMMARTATAQDTQTGDGTTSAVLFCAELMKMSERCISEGVHPRVVSEGFDMSKAHALEFLDQFKLQKPDAMNDRELLINVARTSLRTKLGTQLADHMCEIIVDATTASSATTTSASTCMVEIMHMLHKRASTRASSRGLPRTGAAPTCPR